MALATVILGTPGTVIALGDRRASVSTLTIGTYATNGVAFTPSLFGLVRVDILLIQQAAGYVFEVDYTNSKIKAYEQKDPAAAGGADIALPEVGNGVNLGAVVTRVLAIGS